ncbi:hypothetical protein IIA94_00480 [Patescibacteria group bacterium]|nr:hypothetical protein [Patescibacteria group bacterium]
MRRKIYIFIGLVAVFSFALVLPAQAGTLEQVTVTPSTSQGGISGNYTIDFVVASSTEAESQIRLIFPVGFNVTGATATSTISASSSGASVVATSTVSGQEITLWLADGSITTASDTIEISGINVQSPYAGGSFTLGIETRTLADELSNSASSTAFTIIPSPNTSTAKDTSPPISKITNPTSGLSIPVDKEYVINGTGMDADGSVVKDVEVSVDNGQTWSLAKVYALSGIYNWEYTWQNPTAGEYIIKIRATDSSGNVESASAGVSITVIGSAVKTSTETPAEITGQPIAETTIIQALQNQVVVLQQTLLGLLQQLVQLLQARL